MKRAVVKLEVSVVCEVPDHVYKRDIAEEGMSEEDVWHDYAVGAIQREVEVRHGKDDEDWVKLSAEVCGHELEEGPEDVE
jgi:hypothetical protein